MKKICALTLILAAAAPIFGTTVNLSGQTVTADTTLYSNDASSNAGGSSELFVGRTNEPGFRRALIRFDLSSIPAGATITAVSLQLTTLNVPTDGFITNQVLHKVSASWVEGSGSGSGAGGSSVAGAASWNSRQQGAQTWTTAGGDSSAAVSASATAPTSFTAVTWSAAGMVSDVQGWLAAPATNFGWILIGDETTNKSARGYASSENSSNQPKLMVTFAVSAVFDWVAY